MKIKPIYKWESSPAKVIATAATLLLMAAALILIGGTRSDAASAPASVSAPSLVSAKSCGSYTRGYGNCTNTLGSKAHSYPKGPSGSHNRRNPAGYKCILKSAVTGGGAMYIGGPYAGMVGAGGTFFNCLLDLPHR